MNIEKHFFGKTAEGDPADLYTLSNDQGMQVQITNFGGIVTSIKTADREGNIAEVTLGYTDLGQYENNTAYFGSIVGRFANRIENCRFVLDGQEYLLAQNHGDHHLHGGDKGFDQVIWTAEPFLHEDKTGLRLTYQSADGEENYPGTLDVQVTYSLDNENALTIDYTATTDKKTVINLTNHTYFNLSGSPVILDHELLIAAQQFICSDIDLIPTGELSDVEGTPLDFTRSRRIGEMMNLENELIKEVGGYDHGFVLPDDGRLRLAARVVEPASGRVLETYTTEPDIHFYSGNFLDETIPDREGKPLQKWAGFCLEAQHYPDSPNKPQFPSTVLLPGEVYRQKTIYKFS